MAASRTSRTWEDDAWKIDSDDEDFVKASRTSSGGGSSASVSRLTRNGNAGAVVRRDETPTATATATATTSALLSSQPTHTERHNTSKPQRHAPPARPHPYPTGEPESGSFRADRRTLAADDVPRRGSRSSSVKSVDAASSEQSGTVGPAEHQVTGGHWTLVERSSSMGSAQAGLSKTGPARAQDDANGSHSLEGTALEVDEDTSAARSPKLAREALQKAETAAIQDDLEDVLNDPTAMLARLSIARQDPRSLSRSKDEAAVAATAATPPPSALHRNDSASTSSATQRKSKNTFDATNAVVAVDGIVTTLPASSDHFDASSLDVAGRDVVVLSDSGVERKHSIRSERRKAAFIRCLHQEVIRMDELRRLAWAGVPDDLRPMVWMLLLGYLPPSKAVRSQTLARKRAEYSSGVRNAFQRGTEELDQAIWHQIHIDVPRTNPGITLWQRQATQRALERILYVWAIRHPASGYVQGINDLATPFFEVFLGAYIHTDPEQYDVALLPPGALEALEADTFWCLSKLLDGIQDNYIFAQPGIQRQVRRMGELVSRINPQLHGHFEEQSVEYMQFAFRWMNCLLMRELSVRNIVRMWDSYLAEGPDAFSDFHLFVCAAFLDRWSDELRRMDFQGIIMFLQSLPTQNWTAKETELLLADAFVKKSLFGGTAHLTN